MKKTHFISVIATLLTLAMLIGLFPASTFAAENKSGITESSVKVTESTNNTSSAVQPYAVSSSDKSITPKTKMMYLKYSKYTLSGGTFPVKSVSQLSLLGDAAFCVQHEKATPYNGVEMSYVGKMSDYLEGDLTKGLTALWVYRVIKSAQDIINTSTYSSLTINQKLQAIQTAINNPDAFASRYLKGIGGGSYTAAQAKLFGQLYQAIDTAARASKLGLPTEEPVTATRTGGNYFTGTAGSENAKFVLATYSLNFTGVTAKITSTNVSGANATVSGTTLTVSIPAKKMPKSGTVSVNVSLSAPEQQLEVLNLYTEGTGKRQKLVLMESASYNPIGATSDRFEVYQETGSVEVTKVDAANTSKKLAGAVFIIVNKDTGEIIELPATDSNGHTATESPLKIGRYTITESIAPEGYARSDWSQDFEITPDSTTKLSYTVENRPANASWTPYVFKWEVDTEPHMPVRDYTFELLQDGVVIQTTSTHQISSWWGTLCHQYSFSSITFSKEDEGKEFHFTIREKDTGIPGVVYNPGHLDITLKVKDVSATSTKDRFDITYEPTDTVTCLLNGGSDYVFVNYIPAEVSWTPTVTKQFTNGTLKDGQFTFALYEDGKELQRVTNKADGSIPFTAIQYTADDIGTHTYTIKEIVGNDSSIHYDTHEVTIVVEVSFPFPTNITGSGDLWSNPSLTVTQKSTSGSITFNNTVEKKGSWTPTANKQLAGGSLTAGQFTFSLYEGDQELQRVTNKADGSIPFSAINYTLSDVGEHTYTIVERVDGQIGISYDRHTLTYTVTVSDTGGSALTVFVSAEGSATFTNRYDATSVTVTKVWVDNNGRNGLRKDVHLTLFGSNGEEIYGTIPVGESSYTWNDLPKYDATGELIEYEVVEADMDGYAYEVTKSGDGYTFVITNTEVTNVSVTKVWVDNDQNDLRKDVQLTLTGSDGSSYTGTIPVGENSYTWEYLPVYTADDVLIVYTLSEVAVDGYTTKIENGSDGYTFTVTNTHTSQETSYTVHKKWIDNGNQDGVRPTEITVTIKGSDGSTYTATFSGSGDDWSYTFTELPKYGSDRELIIYTIESENAVPGYAPSIEGDTITNTHVPEKTTFPVHKKWVDNNNQDGVRPAQITVTIKGSDGKTYTATFDGTGDDWSYTFEDLPKYHNNGELIVYTIESENAIPGYTSSIDGNTITNTHSPDETTFTVYKKWVDSNNQDGIRPEEITVTIKGSDGKTYTATFGGIGDDWSYTFTGLPMYDDGDLIIYSIESENAVPGYTSSINGDTITNTHTPETTTFTVYKKWVDNGNQDGVRPSQITVTIKGSDGKTYTATFGGSGDDWSYTFEDLPKYYNNGELIEYMIKSENAIPGYTSSIDGNTITNTHSPDETTFTVYKKWVDSNNQDGVRPSEITVTIKGSDGSAYTATFGGSGDDWSYTFEDLPKYHNNGELIVYTIESENAVPGYTPSIGGNTITNTHSPDVTSFTVYKKWVDNNNQDGVRPAEITVTIKGSDGSTYTATFGGTGDDWSFTFENLPMYDDGELITYTVESENAVPGYTSSIDGDTITNTHNPAVTNVTATKVWIDNGNQDGLRTDVQLTLTGSDGSSYTGTIKLGETSYTWTDLPVNADGELIVYTLTETAIDGYTTKIEKGTDGYTFTVTNTHAPDLISVTATKVWDDNDNQDGLRADVQLTLTGSDGSIYTGTIKLGETSFTWTDLPVYADGELIVYTLTEAAIEGYDSEIVKGSDGYTFTVTNSHIPEETTFTVHKKWADNDDQDGIRPEEITVTIKGSDGKTYTATFGGSGNDWSYTFEGLPKYYNNGELIVYTIERENTIPGYTPSISGDTITNTHTPAVTDITATKIWEDNNNQDGLRTDVYLTLIGSDGSSYTGTIKLGETSYTWTDFPVYSDGELIVYTLTEAKIEGYETQIEKESDGYTFTVTNTHTPAVTNVTATKVWDDNDNQDGLRTDVQLTLTGSDDNSYTGTIKLGETSYTWTDIPVYADGELIVYTLTEAAIDGYDSEIVADGYTFTVTNTHVPEETTFTVHKKWADNNNQDGIRPEEITVMIKGSDGKTYTATFGGSGNDWSYTFEGMPKYYNNGELIVYTIESENAVPGYTPSIIGDTITNTHTPAVTDITATKVWVDSNNQDGLRTDVYLTLTGSDGSSYTGTIKLGETSYTWTDFPVYSDGKLIVYTLTESAIEGYDSEIVKGSDGYTFTVTNTHIPEVIEIPIHKVWEDHGNEWNVRPANITFVLYGSDGSERMATVRGMTDEWFYTFTELPKYWNNGELIEYTLEELPVHGYTTEIEKGDDGYSFTVTNTLVYGRLHIIKTAEDGRVEGLRFRIYGVSHQGTTIDIVVVTNADGVARVDYILPGYYYVEEIDVPDRYVAPDRQTIIVIGDDSDPEITTMSFYNELKRMSITVNKTAEDSELVGLAGFKFQITGTDYLGNEIDITGTTDKTGSVSFGNLLAGTYTVTEIETDVRYVVPDEQIVDLTWGVDEAISFHNELKRMTITVSKTAEDSEQVGLAGFKFQLTGTDYMGNTIDIISTTNENGMVVFEDLLAGEYTVTEIETDIRYVVPDEQTVDLTWGVNEAISFQNTLKRMTITVNKTAEDSNLVGLDGFKFQLTGTDYMGNTIDTIGTTDENGVVVFEDLLAGEYIVTEIETDIRYVVPDEQEVNLTWGVNEAISFQNTLKRMTITINKTAEDDILEGHKFRLTGTDYLGNTIDLIGVTDENGVVSFENLLTGDYTVTEIETAIRYVVPDDQIVNLTWGVDESIDFQNTLKRMTITVNKTAEDDVLAGHNFRFTGTDYLGNKIDIIGTTDKNGVVIFENLLAGDYTVTEIETDIRYVVPDEQEVNLTWGADEAISFQNTLKRMSITVNKTAEDSSFVGLAGFKFRLTGTDYLGNTIDLIGETDENGVVVFVNLLAGEYTVTEIETNIRYVVPEDQIVNLTWGVNEAIDFENTLKRMTITVNKTAEDDVLEGHKFRLTGTDYLGNKIDIIGTTDENGMVSFANLLAGEYTITEIKTDIRYVVPDEQEVDLTWGVDEAISFRNELKRMTITVNKTAEDDILEGHKFRLTGTDYLGNTIDLIGETDENGVVVFVNLLAGEYIVTEIETDIRYVVPDEQTVDLTWGVNESIDFQNTLKRMTITVNKTAEDGVLEGHRFRLTGTDFLGNEIDLIGTTDENGVVVFENLLAGEYTVTEIETDVRYVVPEDQTVDLTWGVDEAISFRNGLKRMTITINKTAEDDVLEGHKFRLSGTDFLGNKIDIIGTTDKNGVVVFENLLAGEYTVTEIETDIRYVVPDEQEVNLTWGVDEAISFHNELKRMTITVNKTAEDSELVGLAGFKFRLTGIDYMGSQIDLIGETDENGMVSFANLLAGDYIVTEIEIAIRYIVPDGQDVTVTWGNDESMSFHNDLKKTNVTATKVWFDCDDQDGLRADVHLTLTGSDGSVYTGIIPLGETSFTWTNLPMYDGDELIVYTLTEAKIEGYESEIAKSEDGYSFTVTNTHTPPPPQTGDNGLLLGGLALLSLIGSALMIGKRKRRGYEV